jgi:hypothetical protein
MEVKQKASFLIGLVFVIIGLLAKSVYRNYICSHGIDDFGLADSLPSFLYVIGFSQLLQISTFRFPALWIPVVTLGSVIYEFKQYYTSGTLDFSDIIASLAGGVVSYLILVYVGKRFKNQEK